VTPIARALVAVLLCTRMAAAAETTPGVPWRKDFKAALREARTTGKPVMVDFWAKWCEWCHTLDTTTYRDEKVVALLSEFVPVKVDTEGSAGERALSAQHGVETLPTIAFLSPTGRLFLRHASFEGPETFPALLEKARSRASEIGGWEAALARDRDDPAALSALGVLLSEEKLFAESRDLLRRAARGDRSRPAAERKRTRRALARVETEAGQRDEAVRLLKEAMAITPADPAEDAAAAQSLAALPSR
jgi:thioredoxin-like negative regulator of GroEL